MTRWGLAPHGLRVITPSGCWEWYGRRHSAGYGLISRGRYAHRAAYAQAHGPIDSAQHVLHRCDNPPCCNPAHLFLGTQADNMADKQAKGRQARGARNGSAKLTEHDVRGIRCLVSYGETHAAIAGRFGVAPSQVSMIRNGHTWRHVPGWERVPGAGI